MCTTSEKKDANVHNKGFTLVELMVVIAIMAILAAVAVPSFVAYTEKAKEQVCNINSLQFERVYDTYLTLKDIDHTDAVFVQYLQEFGQDICPEDGDIDYVNGKIQCSVHARGDDDGSVPFL